MTRFRSEKYLKTLRGRPCVVCEYPAEAHHLTFAEPNAMGMKVGDNWCVPLCHSHHMDLHGFGDERLWWALQGIEPIPIAEKLYKEFQHDSTND
jgi:Protein of unknown function (DUF968).